MMSGDVDAIRGNVTETEKKLHGMSRQLLWSFTRNTSSPSFRVAATTETCVFYDQGRVSVVYRDYVDASGVQITLERMLARLRVVPLSVL